jgi:hypothetical protein
MKARGKRERSEARHPWLSAPKRDQGLKGRNGRRRIPLFKSSSDVDSVSRADAPASLRAWPWLSYSAPLAL